MRFVAGIVFGESETGSDKKTEDEEGRVKATPLDKPSLKGKEEKALCDAAFRCLIRKNKKTSVRTGCRAIGGVSCTTAWP